MVVKTVKGTYQLVQNYRDAFQLEAFTEKYIEECMDRYLYVVGDISSGILRLKGFDNDPKSKNYFGNINTYLEVSCALGCPFYVLKRITNSNEIEKLNSVEVITTGGMDIKPIKKVNFDKESLILKTTPKSRPNIVINEEKINAIPKSEPNNEMKEYIKADKATSEKKNPQSSKPAEEIQTTSYVSSSPDFDPALKQQNQRFNKNKNNNNNNNNNNGGNNNSNNNNNRHHNKNKNKNNSNNKKQG